VQREARDEARGCGSRGRQRARPRRIVTRATLSPQLIQLAATGAEWKNGVPDGLDIWGAIVKDASSNRTEVPINVDTCVGLTGGPPCARKSQVVAVAVAVIATGRRGVSATVDRGSGGSSSLQLKSPQTRNPRPLAVCSTTRSSRRIGS
jgi:hypothetical protein